MKIQQQEKHFTIFESALYQTTGVWIQRRDYQLLIDPNYLPIELDFIAHQVRQNDRPLYLYFTHSDYDHVVGYHRFANLATTIASEKVATHPDPDSVLQSIQELDAEFYIERSAALIYPKLDVTLTPETTFHFGADSCHFYSGVGHNRDGLLMYHENLELLIVGDYLSVLEFPLIYESLAAYKKTLKTIEQLITEKSIRWLISGHGAATNQRSDMQRRLQLAWQYLNDLEAYILEHQPFPAVQLWKTYRRSDFLGKMHKANIELARKELVK